MIFDSIVPYVLILGLVFVFVFETFPQMHMRLDKIRVHVKVVFSENMALLKTAEEGLSIKMFNQLLV